MLISISDAGVVYGRKWTPHQIQAIPAITRSNALSVAETQYKIEADVPVVFDNVHGIGAIPDNRSVLYRGFLAQMSPGRFLDLAESYPAGARTRDAERIKQNIKDGYGIGCPTLYLNVDAYMENQSTETQARVTGHEGRARSLALRALGVDLFYVQVHLLGWRAKHIVNPRDFIDYLQAGVYRQASNKIVGSPIQGHVILA